MVRRVLGVLKVTDPVRTGWALLCAAGLFHGSLAPLVAQRPPTFRENRTQGSSRTASPPRLNAPRDRNGSSHQSDAVPVPPLADKREEPVLLAQAQTSTPPPVGAVPRTPPTLDSTPTPVEPPPLPKAGIGTLMVFGPVDFIRSTGKPVEETVAFNLPDPNIEYLVRIDNGGSSDQFDRVSSAVIAVNGAEIARPNDFNQNVDVIERTVILSAHNELTVELRSKPGSGVTIHIFGIDNDPPLITATVNPPPNEAGWHHSNVTVSFECTDTISGIAFCTPPVTITIEGSGQVVEGTAVDVAGNSATLAIALDIDRTPPVLSLESPTDGERVGSPNLSAFGMVSDALSGLNSTACLGSPGVVDGASFSCDVLLELGPNRITVVASDVAGNLSVASANVALNQAPSIISQPGTMALEGQLYTYDVQAVDPDVGDVLTFSLTAGPSGTTINPTTGLVQWTPGNGDIGDRTVAIEVSDQLGLMDSQSYSIVVRPMNRPPTIAAGPDQSITLPANTAVLNYTTDDDGLPEAGGLMVRWEAMTGPGPVQFRNVGLSSTQATFEAAGAYMLRATADDSELTASDEVMVTVNPENLPPFVNAGLDQTIKLPKNTVNLVGSAQDDGLPQGSSLTHAWSVVSAPGDIVFDNPSSLSTQATVSQAGTYILKLTSDDSELSVSDDVSITLEEPVVNQPPSVDAGPDHTITLPDAAILSFDVSDDGLPEDGTLTVSWEAVSGSGSVSFLNMSPSLSAAKFSEAGTYVLRLTASDTELSASDETTVVVQSRPGGNQPPVVNAGADQTLAAKWELLVVSFEPGQVLRFDGLDGKFKDSFVKAGAGGLPAQAVDVVIGPDGNLYVGSRADASILRFSGVDGTLKDVFVAAGSGGLGPNQCMVFGPDRDLYVVNPAMNNVLKFDGVSGDFVDEFVSSNSGGLSGPICLAFGPDGNLYVTSFQTDSVLRYDGQSGSFLDVFASGGGLGGANTLTFGPDGNLYVGGANSDSIVRYDGATGAFVDTFVTPQSGGLDWPGVIVFGPDGDLYVASHLGDSVLRYDGLTGAFIDVFVELGSGGLSLPAGMKFRAFASMALEAEVSDDGRPVGTDVATRWTANSGLGPVAFANAKEIATVASFSETGAFNLRMTADDGELSGFDELVVTVEPDPQPRNSAPVVSAGSDVTITLSGDVLNLVGVVADDGLPLGGSLTTTWSVTSGPGAVGFGDTSALSTTATFSAPGAHILRLTVDDSDLSASDELTVMVETGQSENQAPIAVDDDFTVVTMEPDGSGPQMLDPRFAIEEFATVPLPAALAIPAGGSSFGDYLYAVSSDAWASSVAGQAPVAPDIVYRIDLSTREVHSFFQLPDESDPTAIEFGPGLPYTANLYVSSNNRDTAAGIPDGQDFGGSIVFLEPDPSINGEQFLTPPPPPGALTEPGALTFSNGGDFGINLFVTNTSNQPFGIHSVEPTGQSAVFSPFANPARDNWEIAFGLGNDFGTNMFFTFGPNQIHEVAPSGESTLFHQIEGADDIGAIIFAPTNSFQEDAFVTVRRSGQVSLYRLTANRDVIEFIGGFVGATYGGGAGVLPPPDALEFGRDGNSLFVADYRSDVIYRVFPRISSEGNVLTNDSDADGDPLTAILVTSPENGAVTLNSDGTVFYTPAPGFVGIDTFTYKANDGDLDSNVATVTITVEPIGVPNQAPTVDAGPDQVLPIQLTPTLAWARSSGHLNTGNVTSGVEQALQLPLDITDPSAVWDSSFHLGPVEPPPGSLWATWPGPGACNGTQTMTRRFQTTFDIPSDQFLRFGGIQRARLYDPFKETLWPGGAIPINAAMYVYVNGVFASRHSAAYTSIEPFVRQVLGVYDYGVAGYDALDNTAPLEVGAETGWVVAAIILPPNLFVPGTNTIDVIAEETCVSGGMGLLALDLTLNPTTTLEGQASDDGLPGGEFTTLWSQVSGPAQVSIAEPASLLSRVTPTVLGSYTLRLTADDLALQASDEMQIDLTPINQPPAAEAGTDQVVSLGESAMLMGSVSDDGLPVGGVLRPLWEALSGPGNVVFADSRSAETTATFSAPGIYELRLSGYDNLLWGRDTMTVTVASAGNAPPTVEAGPDQSIILPAQATLVGIATDDGLPSGSTLTTTWSKFSGPGNVTVDDANALATNASFDTPGTYVLRLTATDAEFTTTDDVTVTVNPAVVNQPPIVNAGPDRIIQPPGNSIVINFSVTDDGLPAGGSLSFTWEVISGPGSVSFSNGSPTSITATFGAPGSYLLRLTATDSVLSASDDVVITLLAENVAPVVNAGPDRAITLPTDAVTLNGSATDDGLPEGASLSFTWSQVSGPATAVFGSPNTGSTTATFPTQGVYVLRLSVSDTQLTGIDEVTVTVSAPEVNVPPTVDAGVDRELNFPDNSLTLNFAISDDGLPEGNPLTFSWEYISGPGVVTFGNATTSSIMVTFSLPGVYRLRLSADDGDLSASDDVIITANAANQAPLVNAGVDRTLTLPENTTTLNGFVSNDDLPAGSTVSVVWSLVSGPAPVTFGSPAATSTTATFPQAGTYVLRLTADDTELTGQDDVTVVVNEPGTNIAPTVNTGPDQSLTLPERTVTLNFSVSDDGLPEGGGLGIHWQRVSGPGAILFSDLTPTSVTVSATIVGVYVLRLTANDGELTGSDTMTLVLAGDNQVPEVNAGPDLTANTAENLIINYTATDDGQPAGGALTISWEQVSGPGAALFLNQTLTTIEVSFDTPGTHVLRLTAENTVFSASDDVTITVESADVGPPPEVSLLDPTEGAEITSPYEVRGTVQSDSLDSWELQFGRGSTFRTIASGDTNRFNDVLGVFDPTLLENGMGQLRLRASDTNGQTSTTEPVTVLITGNMKVGNFTVSFNDLTVPMPGISLQIIRTYDSRVGALRDFGVGWTLDIKSVRVQENAVAGGEWYGAIIPGVFGFPKYCVQELKPHIVSVTLPDGTVYKFRARLNIECQDVQPLFPVGTFTLEPLPGTNAELSIVGNADVLLQASWPGPIEFLDADTLGLFDPNRYLLTLPDGRELEISQAFGLLNLTDTNDNRIDFTRDGIFHSGGKSVIFLRDNLGRITHIADPAGNLLMYGYDGAGDLIRFVDQVGNMTTFGYNGNHGLLSIMDPRGIQPIRNEYDESGRLIRNIDAEGNVIEYTHDLDTRQEIITDRLDNITVHEYDDRGNVVQTTDAEGGVTRRTYDERDNMLSETDALGRMRTFTYDENDNQLTEIDPLGNVTEFTYNDLSQVLTITDPMGRVTRNTYDGNGNLTETEDADGNVTKFMYDAAGNQTSQTDALGNTTSYEYDSAGNLTKQTDPLGNETTYLYDVNGNRLAETKTRTTPAGMEILATQFEYDGSNRLVRTIFPDGSATEAIYNSIGKQAFTVDQLGRVTEFMYDSVGNLVTTVFPNGTSQSSTYDAEGRRDTSTDQLGRVTEFEYDKLGRLERTIFADGAKNSTTYDAVGQVTATTDARGNVTRFEYDDAGRRTKVIDALLHETTFEYNDVGNQTSMTDANGNTTQFVYDDLNRRTSVLHPDSTEDVTEYDALGRTTAKTDQAGNRTQFRYDALGRLTEVIDALTQSTLYGYDELGNRISQTDANNHATLFEYDGLGRRTRRTLPLGMFEMFAYDAAGNMRTKTDFNGRTTIYEYDDLNRLTRKTPDPFYAAPPIVFTYTDTGQRESMSDPSGLTMYQYDERDRLVEKATPQGTLGYTYDLQGNLASIVSSNIGGTSVAYTYDELNRLQSVIDNRTVGATTTYAYDNVGNLQGYAYPNGVSHAYSYDDLNRLTTLTVANGSGPLASYAYTLGLAGNRTTVAELGGRRVDYAYDALFRLKQEAIANDASGNDGTIDYLYDAVGNRQSRSSMVPPIPGQIFTYDANDRLTLDAYDDNGNTVASEGRTFTYEFENRLTGMNGGEVSIVYDGDGNRVARTVEGVTTRYLTDDRNLTGYAQVLEEVVGGTVPRVYTYGLNRISQSQASGTSFYGYDGHGSVRLLTDATGAVTDRYDYDAFGNALSQTGTTPNVYLYSGEQNDPNLGSYYLRARYLSTDRDRFLTGDPVAGTTFDPLSLHRYLYASANPVNLGDPSGQFSTIVELGIASAISGTIQAIAIGVREGSIRSVFTPRNLTEIGIAAVAGAVGGLAAQGISAGARGLANLYGTHFVRHVLPVYLENTTAATAASVTSEFLRLAVFHEPIDVRGIAFATFGGIAAGGFIVKFRPMSNVWRVTNLRWPELNVHLGSRPLVGTGGVLFGRLSDILWEALSTAAEEEIFP